MKEMILNLKIAILSFFTFTGTGMFSQSDETTAHIKILYQQCVRDSSDFKDGGAKLVVAFNVSNAIDLTSVSLYCLGENEDVLKSFGPFFTKTNKNGSIYIESSSGDQLIFLHSTVYFNQTISDRILARTKEIRISSNVTGEKIETTSILFQP